jgi:predicted ribosomally synthesized peptide with SipW-like signal peptide
MTDERFDISRRKALAALGTIGVASAGAGLGTSAYFSDQETFENNQLVAGTLDLGVGYTAHYSDWSDDEDDDIQGDIRMFEGGPDEVGTAGDLESGEVGLPADDAWLIAVDSESAAQQFLDNTRTGSYPELGEGEPSSAQSPIGCGDLGAETQADGAPKPVIDLDDVKPGDFGEVTFDFVLCDNPGYVWLNGELTEASENGVTEPEADDPDEDQVEGEGSPDLKDDADQEEGKTVELLDVVMAAVWIDDGNNYQNGDESPFAIGSLREILGLVSEESNGTELNSPMNAEFGGGTGDQGCFDAGTEYSLAFAWWVPIDHGNEIQSDSATFELGLYTEQCRHNDGSGMNNAAVPANETDDADT